MSTQLTEAYIDGHSQGDDIFYQLFALMSLLRNMHDILHILF